MKATDLKPGDRYIRPSYSDDEADIIVEIVEDRETVGDRFGRDMIKFWARRLDTQQEGYVMFGPTAQVKRAA